MGATTAKEYYYKVERICISNASPPQHRQAIGKKRRNCSYSLLIFLLLALATFAQIPRFSTAAALPDLEDNMSESLASTEDTLNLLHELARFMHRENGLAHDNRIDKDHIILGKKLHKRHNSAKQVINTNDDKAEWQNICGMESDWSDDEVSDNLNHDYVQLYMKNLRKSINLEYKALKSNGLNDIDIDDMRAWRRHERKYKFLPTLDHNSPIAPACWHQSIQIFIASFAYLYEIQQQLDQQHLHTHSGIAHELHALLQSSKRILCEIETSIRGSYPRDKRQLKVFTRDEMLAKINFYTTDSTRALSGQRSVNHTDLRFAKFFYQNYLLRILRLLPHHNKNIQLQYTCEKPIQHHNILDKNWNNEAPIMSNEIDVDTKK